MEITTDELIEILKTRIDRLKNSHTIRPMERGISLRRVKDTLTQIEKQLAPKNEQDLKDFLEGMK